ncbi:MAG: squalene--hopene cyclase [Planctomycetes bacterium]|nr:squalene--hopene cyclase [Planctomycetota bacterium]
MTPTTTPDRLEAAYQTALAALLKERTPAGHWVGELSTSALSTATAVMALHLVNSALSTQHSALNTQHSALSTQHSALTPLIEGGLAWLAANQNADGGWGDTTVNFSNISTTMLCRSAFYLVGRPPAIAALMPGLDTPHHARSDWWGVSSPVSRAEAWLQKNYGRAEKWPEAIRQRYGKDRTFATPILTTCALAGLVSWDEVPPLPFELAVLPQSWYRFVRLHVVSYALPALIAIGQCIYHHRKPRNPVTRILRALSRKRALNVLLAIQPSSGGFLEAIPLTSFVTLSLASIGHANHPVAQSAVRFLVNTVRPDGSWAIDSNLATWVTTLSVNALAAAGELDALDKKDELRNWLLNQQYKARHPYTGADPGGWAWTDLPGGVPDADDTPGAILALSSLSSEPEASAKDSAKTLASASGSEWLRGLQNRDGGWPTFCRGWGHLPFDRSGSDLTAHVLRALNKELGSEPNEPGFAYLAHTQRPDGSWLPLWFGNQHMPDDENPTYGTARVLAAYRDLHMMDTEPARKGIAWLLQNQNLDGGWGGGLGTPSSVEETALALDVLIPAPSPSEGVREPLRSRSGLVEAVNKGLTWLVGKIEQGGLSHPTPIGFYFAKLWYFEKLYPIIFTVSALGRARKSIPPRTDPV